MRELASGITSLDQPVGDDGDMSLGDLLQSDEPAPDQAEGLELSNAFDFAAFDLQLPLLEAARAAGPVYAYLWKYGGDNADLRAKVQAVQQLGFDGYFLWVWNRDLDGGGPEQWSLPRSDREGVS